MRKRECYFYSEFCDMGALIPCCDLCGDLGVCPCVEEECDKFLDKADAHKIVMKYINGKLVEKK